MLFNSWEFLILLLVTVPLYYLPMGGLRRRVWQVLLLLAASAVFYAWEEPRLLLLLGLSCVANAVAVERIIAAKAESRNLKSEIGDAKAKRWLFWTVALNLAFLAFFKYAGFLANLFPDSLLPESCKLWLSGIPLPVGISFYTFQGLSMVVDVWRDDISEQTRDRLAGRGRDRISSVRDTSFYIVFFPQLVAGPIVKAHEFVDQIGAKFFREIDWLTVRRGLILGYFLKVFVADNLAEQTGTLTMGAEVLAASGPIPLASLLYGYSLQIFADFAGYSLIAIGLGALFGYKLPPNFNFPYLSTSITEFWRRWHLSLSSWLRDYLYIPLGGNRKGTGRTYFNLFLVMFLGGLWHGAAWKFAIWGSLHGLFLAFERLLSRRQNSSSSSSSSGLWSLASGLFIFRWLITFHLVTLLWLTFMMPDMASIVAFFKGLFNGKTGFSGPPIFSLLFYGSAVVLYHAWGWLQEHRQHLANHLARSPLEPVLHGVMLFLIITNPGAPRGFIYFQF
jgi:alginate O-acetyltransferase complex protein AlgI